MSEEQNTEQNIENMTEMDMFNALVNQLQETMDPRDFMTPTQREIAYLTTEELESEYQLVQARESNRGRMQRDLIVSRYEYEQQKLEQDDDNA
jgi:hypothetical protein